MKQILVVDDDEDFTNMIVNSLNKGGYKAMGFTSGELGMKAMALGVPDLVLIDLIMPGLDGFDFLRSLQEKYPLVNVIVISGYIEAKTEKIIKDLGATGFIKKPLIFEELLKAIEVVSAS